MFTFLRAFLGVLLSVCVAHPVLACRFRPPSAAAAYRNADIVVRASVLSVEGEPYRSGGARAKLRVDTAWKADIAGDITVNTSTTCAVDFQVGKDYLIFLHRKPTGELTTTIDMGDRILGESDAALNWLRRHGRKSQLRQN
ncbi:MAG: hypothetical protein FWD68_00520 [Alphaproteobacteria bacterium]|nr:hypothetical protein [Alphaproteobacteria bacterium]